METIVNELLKALSEEDPIKGYQNRNNDFDLSEVLKSCASNSSSTHILRYPDGQEKEFSFNK